MNPSDLSGFFANQHELNPEDYLLLDYYLECSGDPRLAAAHFCSEQSTA
ncbi:ribulose 1,5-bisphosphate carboxylase, partial [Citrobacter sp. AAK_AS5]